MRLVETSLKDAYQIDLIPKEDHRGAFCRLFCTEFLAQHNIPETSFEQVNISDNTAKGTLRGMHFQDSPHLEAKIIYCLHGSAYDVIIDLRSHSSTYLQHFSMVLTQEKPCALYIPKGFAHGFLTLQANTRLLYLMSASYKPGFERGYRFDDPAFGITWPFMPSVISERDQLYSPYEHTNAIC